MVRKMWNIRTLFGENKHCLVLILYLPPKLKLIIQEDIAIDTIKLCFLYMKHKIHLPKLLLFVFASNTVLCVSVHTVDRICQ